MWLYDYTRNLKEALNYATLLCGCSVYHGIFQSYFGGEQFVHNVEKNQIMITHLCPMGQENVNWLQERDCIHGIGDGLVKLYNYNTTVQLIVVMSLYHYWHKAHAQEVYLWKTMIISSKQEKVILTNMTFIPLVTEQLKNLPLSAITIIRSMCWKETISHSNTISHMHLPNAIIYLQTNLQNIVIKVLADCYNQLHIQIPNRQL